MAAIGSNAWKTQGICMMKGEIRERKPVNPSKWETWI